MREVNEGRFTNSFARTFGPLDYTRVSATPVSSPRLLAWSESAAALVGLSPSDDMTAVLAGNALLPGMDPIATRYGGHQFGHWAGQLGDGRALLLGETNGQEIQLKGAGPTPYSRRADGRAVLRSSLREYLCSEAMHFLGVPTTRALSLVATGDEVVRDMFYDGNPAPEPGAITTRIAPSFVRFGHFEIHAALGEENELRRLADYVLSYYPGHTLESFFNELCVRTAKLMVEWLRVGFVHGVMNTDNMSVLGLTIDYGPYGWLDSYQPEWTPNTTDAVGKRYRFSQQPSIALWNLHQLARALMPLGLGPTSALENYRAVFFREWQAMMAAKLGLASFDAELVRDLDGLLQAQETDMTLFYRSLAEQGLEGMVSEEVFYQPLTPENRARWEAWLPRWRALAPDVAKMNRVNPAFLLRNYLAQEAVDGLGKDDDTRLRQLEKALLTPYEVNDATRPFMVKRPEWARHRAGCSALSCSS